MMIHFLTIECLSKLTFYIFKLIYFALVVIVPRLGIFCLSLSCDVFLNDEANNSLHVVNDRCFELEGEKGAKNK
jgi:hypothetical protein